MQAAEAHVRLVGLSKAFGGAPAVADFSLSVPRGSFTTLLGPSGCGKTTALRMVAGYVAPDAGRVEIAGQDQTGRPPNLRGVGMVFQDYALFPHMSVRANLEYGLRMRRRPRGERREKAESVMELLGLGGLGERYPHELSGGQQQRVALGRVLVLGPEVLLMDEPFSNLDAKLRLRLRAELKGLQRQLGVTTIYVTHDQEEALSLSDQVVVMQHGRGQQVGAPADVYRRPANRFVAEFVGQANLLPVRVARVVEGGVAVTALGRPLLVRLPDERTPATGTAGLAVVRPEQVSVLPSGAAPAGGGWWGRATLVSRGFHGAFERCLLRLDGVEQPWVVDVPAGAAAAETAEGTDVVLTLGDGAACWAW